MRKKLLYLSLLALFLTACANPTLQSGGPSVPMPSPSGSTGSSGGSSGGGSSGGGSSGGGSSGGGSAGGGSSGGGSSGGGSAGGGSSGGGSAGGGSSGGPSVGMPTPGTGIPGGVPVPMPGSSGGSGGEGSTAGTQGSGDQDGDGSGDQKGTDGSGSGTSQQGSGDGDGSIAGGADIPVWEPTPSFDDSDSEESEDASDTAGTGQASADVSLEDMEKTLEKAMGTFDEEILREQENARNQTGNNGSGARDKEVIAGVGEFETYGNSTSNVPSSGNAGQSSGPGDGSGAYADDAPPPASDDDIVARQIREAAMNEPDPEQRAVLWEEYERYKSGL